MPIIGVTFAIGTLISWGIGDFFIQRGTRDFGVWKTLLCITVISTVVLFPFIYKEIPAVFTNLDLLLLLSLTSIVILFTALFGFEALREGKIAIIEPIISMELPIAVILGIIFLHDFLIPIQFLLIVAIFLGVLLVVTLHPDHLRYHRRIVEKGVIYAGLGAIGLGLTNFLMGAASKATSPLFAVWFTHGVIAAVCIIRLFIVPSGRNIVSGIKKYWRDVAVFAIFDNGAWILYGYAVRFIPVAITVAITEGYIVLAALLGILVNRERLKLHQFIGAAITAFGVITLAIITGST